MRTFSGGASLNLWAYIFMVCHTLPRFSICFKIVAICPSFIFLFPPSKLMKAFASDRKKDTTLVIANLWIGGNRASLWGSIWGKLMHAWIHTSAAGDEKEGSTRRKEFWNLAGAAFSGHVKLIISRDVVSWWTIIVKLTVKSYSFLLTSTKNAPTHRDFRPQPQGHLQSLQGVCEWDLMLSKKKIDLKPLSREEGEQKKRWSKLDPTATPAGPNTLSCSLTGQLLSKTARFGLQCIDGSAPSMVPTAFIYFFIHNFCVLSLLFLLLL